MQSVPIITNAASSNPKRGVLDTTLSDKVCQWFSPGTLVSSTNKTDRHDRTEIFWKMMLNIINLKPTLVVGYYQGRIQDFKLGRSALKKIAPSGGRREHFWGISCEKSRFYAKI
jgi:hypothetical protein